MARNGTLIEQVMADIRAGIASRTYLPGTRLPSLRAQASAASLSVSTVVEAYERLAAEGVISSRPGAGFYVAGPVAPLALTEMGPKLDREVDPLWVSRQSLESDASVLKPGCGWLPTAWMYEDGIRRALRAQARAESLELTEYATPLGHLGLRQLLSRRIAVTGMEASPEQIVLTESGTHAIDLICRFLLKPGDKVLVDDPCYFNFHALLKAHQVQVMGVPYTPNGPDVAKFEAALREHAPRMYITNSGIHNPTGATLSSQVAYRILKLADDARLVIVEDDIFADFEDTPAPRLAALDGLARVIHIGSFSKSISASVRCGYIAARPDWIEGIADLKIATTFGGGRLADVERQWLSKAPGSCPTPVGDAPGQDCHTVAQAGHQALARSSGRDVSLVPPTQGYRCDNGCKELPARARSRCAWQCVQPILERKRLYAIQCCAMHRRACLQCAQSSHICRYAIEKRIPLMKSSELLR